MNRILKCVLTVGALIVLSLTLVAPAPAVHAAPVVNMDCIGPAQTTYSPGMLSTTQAVTWEETNNYSHCASSDPAISWGTASASGVAELSCFVESVVTYENPVYVITWNNGETSNFASTVTIRQLNGVIVGRAVGQITEGRFAGAAATSWWFYPLVDRLQCEQPPGVTSQSGMNTLQIRSK
jgi:hypothetical protein